MADSAINQRVGSGARASWVASTDRVGLAAYRAGNEAPRD